MRGVGNLCIGADSDPHYDARRLVELLIAGHEVDRTDYRARQLIRAEAIPAGPQHPPGPGDIPRGVAGPGTLL